MNTLATRSPVNQQAARILQRAPWWAHHHEITKQVERIMPPHEWSLHADLFLPPPRSGSQDPKDRRGTRIKFINPPIEAVITGHQRTKERCRAKDGSKVGKIHYWWAIADDGVITTVKWGAPSDTKGNFTLLA